MAMPLLAPRLQAAALGALILLLAAAGLQRWPAWMLDGPSLPTERVRASVEAVPPHGRCAFGGHELQFGLDLNGNGLLDARERQQSLVTCREPVPGPVAAVASTLVQVTALAAVPNCPNGGARLSAGPDAHADGRLSASETSTDRLWCATAFSRPARAHGSQPVHPGFQPHQAQVGQQEPTGADDGLAASPESSQALLIRLAPDASTRLCAGDGSTATIGLDSNRNGRLDDDEIQATQHLCGPQESTSTDDDGIAALPPSARIGQIVQFQPPGARPWRIAQSHGQRINTETLSGAWGGNWAPTGPKAAWQALAQSADGRQLMVAGDGVLLRSSDSGHSWLPTGPTQRLRWTGLAASADGRRWVATSASDALYTSTDSGQSWQRRSIGLGWGLVASSADGQRLLASRYGTQLLVSEDGGQSWVRRAPRADWVSLAVSADGQVLAAVAAPGRLHVSRDGGQTWHIKGAIQRYSAVAIAARTIGLAASVTDASTVASASVQAPRSGLGLRIVTAARDGEAPLRWTDDFGDTWQAPDRTALRAARFEALAVSAQGQALVASTDDGWLWTSADAGHTWRRERSDQRIAALGVSAEGLARVALPRGEAIHRAAAATTPGQAGALNLRSEQPVSLQYLGTGIWAVLGFSGSFYVQ